MKQMKRQKSAIFIGKYLKINTLQLEIKNIVKLEIIAILQGNIEMLHISYAV